MQKATLINSITEVEGQLILSMDNALLSKISESHHSIQKVYIECNKGKFEVTLGGLLKVENNTASYIISSIEPQKNELAHGPRGESSKEKSNSCQSVKTMRNVVGLDINDPLVLVTQISKGPIMELMPEERANDDTPNSETTSLGVQPHTTGNDRPVNA